MVRSAQALVRPDQVITCFASFWPVLVNLSKPGSLFGQVLAGFFGVFAEISDFRIFAIARINFRLRSARRSLHS